MKRKLIKVVEGASWEVSDFEVNVVLRDPEGNWNGLFPNGTTLFLELQHPSASGAGKYRLIGMMLHVPVVLPTPTAKPVAKKKAPAKKAAARRKP